MSILPPLSSSPLTGARLAELLESEAVAGPYPHLLRWLVWFPLLSASELTRLEQSRWAKQEQTRSPQWVAARLQELEVSGLIAHVVVNEPGWPPHQHRYFLTDAGLYVFAAAADPPLPVPKLAQAYAVERADLIERLSHIDIHLVLADFSSRLVTEGSGQGFSVTSFQQPWMQTDTIFGHGRPCAVTRRFCWQISRKQNMLFMPRSIQMSVVPSTRYKSASRCLDCSISAMRIVSRMRRCHARSSSPGPRAWLHGERSWKRRAPSATPHFCMEQSPPWNRCSALASMARSGGRLPNWCMR